MIVNSHPTRIHTAFNPVNVVCSKGTEDIAKIKIVAGNVDTLPNDYITIEREYFNGATTFDISRVLKKMFGDTISGNSILINSKLKLAYSVFNGINDSLIYKGLAINAVVQIGQSTDFVPYLGYFLTSFSMLRKYNGYPLQVYALGFELFATYILQDGISTANTNEKHFGFEVTAQGLIELSNSATDFYLRGNNGQIIYDNQNNPILITDLTDGYVQRKLDVDYSECDIPSPFYVRWINDLGGVDYWMFSVNQIIENLIKSTDTFSPVIQDNENTLSTDEIINIETIDKITFGSENINADDYNALSKIPYSPKVEFYKNGKWFGIVIDKFENKDNSSAELKSIEFTFKLPTKNLQF